MIAGLLILIIAIALFLRIYFPWEFVFNGEFIRFYGVDDYKILWVVGRIVGAFPKYLVGSNLWEYTISGFANMVSIGKPSIQNINLAAAWITPVFSCFSIVATFFIGKILFNKWVGLISAALLATFGGEYISRTLLGNADYHGFEVFLTTMMVLFIILAVKRHRSFIIGAGFFYGCYFLTWGGAPLFALIFNIWLFVQFIQKHVNNEDSTPVLAMGTEFYLVTMAVTIVTEFSKINYFFLIACLLFPVVLYIVSYAMRKVQHYYYPAVMVFAIAIGMGLSYIVYPKLWFHFSNYAVYMFSWSNSIIGEELPLFLTQSGEFTLSVMWFNFGIALILALIGVAIVWKDKEKSILIVWFAIIFLTTLALRRFTYYLAVPVALLTGYLCYFIVNIGITKQHKTAIAGLLVCVLFIPNIASAVHTASAIPQTYYSYDWYKTTIYLRDNMPFKKYLKVMSWADYGYWLRRDGKVEVVCDPAQGEGVKIAAEFFTCTDELQAYEILKENASPFIVIDKAMVTNKFNSIAVRASSPIRYQSDGYTQTMLYRLYNEQIEGYYLFHQQGEVKILRNDEIVKDTELRVYRQNISEGTVCYGFQ